MINAVVLHSECLPAPRKNNILIKILISLCLTTVNISQTKDIVTNETNRYDSKIST